MTFFYNEEMKFKISLMKTDKKIKIRLINNTLIGKLTTFRPNFSPLRKDKNNYEKQHYLVHTSDKVT